MTDQHPAVAHLLAAHERAVALAEAGTRGEWIADGGSVYVGHPMNDVVDWAYDDNGPHIALHSPDSVLLRVAEERNILAEHTPTPRDSSGEYCMVCSQAEEQPQPVGWWVPYPCRTVVGLAKAWGWKEDCDG